MDVTAICVRSGDWWAVTVPEVAGAFTQAKRLDQVEAMVADAVALLADVAAENVHVDVKPELDEETRRLLEEATTLQADAVAAQERASQASRAAVTVLRDRGLSVRDVGRLLMLSPQRVSQLQQSARTFSFKVAADNGHRTVYDAQVVRHDVDPDNPFRGRCGADLSEQPTDEPFTGHDRDGETACRECARLQG
jgi:predicted RNase H-like HicB family nuclease